MQDISKELKLEKQNNAMFNNSIYGMAIFVDGKYVKVNQKYCDWTGFSKEELFEMIFILMQTI